MIVAQRTLITERLYAQLLSGPPALDAPAVAERLLAIQGQDPRGARLAVRARTAGLTAAAVDRALTEERSLVVTWLNRGTLHVVRSDDLPWLHALTAPATATAIARRLAQEGVPPDDAERGVAAVVTALSDEGLLLRGLLRERVAAAGVRTQGQALVHVLALASLRGLIVRGPVQAGEQAFVLWEDWLGSAPPVDRDSALAELARRYLSGHGPATDRDLSRWAGIGLRDARAGLGAIAPLLHQRDDGLVDLAGRLPPPPLPPPRLLGAFDPLLLGWTSREPILGDHGRVVTVNGIFRPFALAGGRAVATWRWVKGEVVLEPLGRDLAAPDRAALAVDAQDVARFLAAGEGS